MVLSSHMGFLADIKVPLTCGGGDIIVLKYPSTLIPHHKRVKFSFFSRVIFSDIILKGGHIKCIS